MTVSRPHIHHLLVAIGLAVPAAGLAQSMTFEEYYPHRVNQVLVFEYSAAAEGESQQSFEGTLTRSPAAPETRDGVTYQTVENTTEGLPDFYPKRWKSYHRETGDGLYSGRPNDAGEIEEYIEFPAEAEPGEPWEVASQFWETQILSLVPRVETAAGTFEDCILVERTREDAASGQALNNTTTYCPGVSAVRSIIEHVAPAFRSVTAINLIEVRR